MSSSACDGYRQIKVQLRADYERDQDFQEESMSSKLSADCSI